MAITEIHSIKTTLDRAVAYICNPDKTDDKLLVSSFACAPETAHLDFAFTRQNAKLQSSTLAHHLIQAFKPGEVTPQTAHKIGEELADKLLEGRYSYVITTHIDKGHVHNHIIFNAVNNDEYTHYNDCKKSYYRIRHLSDNLCSEHGLSVIEKPSGERGKTWYQWKLSQDDIKDKLRSDIKKSIQVTDSFDEFLEFMKAKGYKIKVGKYISFCPPGRSKFIRGSVKSLGKNYTKEQIENRITGKAKSKSAVAINHFKFLIAIPSNPEILEANPALKKWATKENLKRMAETYNQLMELGVSNMDELNDRIKKSKSQMQELRKEFKDASAKEKSVKEIYKYYRQYDATKDTYQKYKKSYLKDRFFRENESEIIIHETAKQVLEDAHVDTEKEDVNKFAEAIQHISVQKVNLKEKISIIKRSEASMEMMMENINEYLNVDANKKEQNVNHINKGIEKEHTF